MSGPLGNCLVLDRQMWNAPEFPSIMRNQYPILRERNTSNQDIIRSGPLAGRFQIGPNLC